MESCWKTVRCRDCGDDHLGFGGDAEEEEVEGGRVCLGLVVCIRQVGLPSSAGEIDTERDERTVTIVICSSSCVPSRRLSSTSTARLWVLTTDD